MKHLEYDNVHIDNKLKTNMFVIKIKFREKVIIKQKNRKFSLFLWHIKKNIFFENFTMAYQFHIEINLFFLSIRGKKQIFYHCRRK